MHVIQAGRFTNRVSFQRVVVPLLHLVTQPRFANSTLTELRNPVLATLHAQLPLDRVRHCISAMTVESVQAAHRGTEVCLLTHANMTCDYAIVTE